jgi:molecular chaperone DnaJ
VYPLKRVRPGADVRLTVEPDTEPQAPDGRALEIVVEMPVSCSDCAGTGSVSKAGAGGVCADCRGDGRARTRFLGRPDNIPCGSCRGYGDVLTDPCATCSATGRVVAPREVRVRIPSDVPDGAVIRLRAEGEAGWSGGPPGDLYIELRPCGSRG